MILKKGHGKDVPRALGLSLAGLSLHNSTGTSRFSAGSSYISDEQQNLAPRHVNGNNQTPSGYGAAGFVSNATYGATGPQDALVDAGVSGPMGQSPSDASGYKSPGFEYDNYCGKYEPV